MHTPTPPNSAPASHEPAQCHTLHAQPLTPQTFAPFGTVIAIDGQADDVPQRSINAGTTQRFDLLADMQLTADGGVPSLAIFRTQARQFPLPITEMERHVLGSQTFVPLGTQRFVVVVACPGHAPQAADLHAFVTNGRQGVVLAPGTWHHALLAMEGGDFVVVERRSEKVDSNVISISSPALSINLPN